jgi:hypothetical protein
MKKTLTLTLILIFLIFWISFWKYDNIESYKYVEKIFYDENKDNLIFKCEYDLRKISYAFAKLESGNCKFWLSLKTKNCWSIHRWWRFYKRRDWKSYIRDSEPLRIYTRYTAWNYDFMYLYYYWYWCNITYRHSLYYIYWRWPYTKQQWNHWIQYTNQLLQIIDWLE